MCAKPFSPAVILAVLMAIYASCTPAPEPPGSGATQPGQGATPLISIREMHTEAIEVARDKVTQNNCGGTAEAENVIERTRAVEETLEVSSEFSVNAGGQVSILGTGVNLGASVAGRLGRSYGTTQQVKRSLTVKTAAHSSVEYEVSLEELWNVGEATVTLNGQNERIPFRFRSDFQMSLVNSVELPCATLTKASVKPIHEPTAIPAPAFVPTAVPDTPTPKSAPTAVPDTPRPTFAPTVVPDTPPPSAAQVGDSGEFGGVEFVRVPGGPFLMGKAMQQNSPTPDEEMPEHTIVLPDFWIMRTEVTNAQYERCVAAGTCTAPHNTFWNELRYQDHPVVSVTWYEAQEYARWFGGRLPSEAEWEKTCRGTDGRIYPWGDQDPTPLLANFNSISTEPVGTFQDGVSPYGALDMAGSVWEWTSSQYRPYPYDANDGRESEAGNRSRILRGGSFHSVGDYIRCTHRAWDVPTSQGYYSGFRVVIPGP